MRRIVALLVFVLACAPLTAEENPAAAPAAAAPAAVVASVPAAIPAPSLWKWKGMFGASYNSTSVSDNWSGAEKDAQSWGAKLDVSGERDTEKNNFSSALKEEYGRTKTSGSEEQVNSDIVDLTAVYTRKLSFYVNPYVGLTVNTQNYRFLDPVTYTESLGNGVWILNSPVQQLKSRAGIAFRQKFSAARDRLDPVSGLTVRYSAADDPATAEIEESRFETGGEWVTNYDVLLNANTKFITEARLFSAFNGGANLRWDSSLYVKLSRLLTLQLNYLALYNYDNTPHPVWPQDIEKRLTLILGFSYNLF